MYYIEKENKIVLFDESLEKLQNTLVFMPEFEGLEIQETARPIADFQFADTEAYKAELARKERERLDQLSLTPADVERALYVAKGMDFDDLLELVAQSASLEGSEALIPNFHSMSPLDGTTSGEGAESLISNNHSMSPLDGGTEISDFEGGDKSATPAPPIDLKALKIEFRAKDFYRGASLADGTRLFDVVGALLGYTPEDMDYLFENKALPNKDEVVIDEEVQGND